MKKSINLLAMSSILMFASALKVNAETPSLENANNATEVKFTYSRDDLVPMPLPKIPINEETKLQETLTVEDLKKLASITEEQQWRELTKKVIRYQRQLLTNNKSISLNEAIELAIEKNPTIQENKYDVLASIWRIRAETRRWLPTIDLELDTVGYYKAQLYVNSRNPNNPNDGNGSAVSYSSNYFQGAPVASISWDAFDPERGPSIMIEKTAEQRDKILLNYSLRSLLVDVYQSFTEIEIILEQINAYSELVSLEIAIADAIFDVYENGLTSIAEVTKWRAQTYSTITQLIGYYQRLDNAYARFSRVIGSDEYFPAQPSDNEVYLEKWPLSLDESIAKAKKENERIKSAYLNSKISELKSQRLIDSYLPTVTLTASAGNYTINGVYEAPLYQSAPILPTTDQKTQNPIYQIYAGLTFEFDGGINLARAKAEEMNAKREKYSAVRISNETVESVRNSYNGLVNQTINLEATERSVENAAISLIVYKQRFIAGISDTTPFIQALNLYTTSIISRSTVKTNLIRDYVNLLRATATWPKSFEISLNQAIKRVMSSKN